jgi:hypothetical protein
MGFERALELVVERAHLRCKPCGMGRQAIHILMHARQGLIRSTFGAIGVSNQPPVQFVGEGNHRASVFVRRAMHRHAQDLPTLRCARPALEVAGDFLPPVQNLAVHKTFLVRGHRKLEINDPGAH